MHILYPEACKDGNNIARPVNFGYNRKAGGPSYGSQSRQTRLRTDKPAYRTKLRQQRPAKLFAVIFCIIK